MEHYWNNTALLVWQQYKSPIWLSLFYLSNKDIKKKCRQSIFFLRFYHCVLLSCPMISSIHCHLIWGMCVEITFWSLANFEHFWSFKKLFEVNNSIAMFHHLGLILVQSVCKYFFPISEFSYFIIRFLN